MADYTDSESGLDIDIISYLKRLKSVVWKYFGIERSSNGTVQKDSRVICKLCSEKVAHSGRTTNLKNHLQTNHRAQYEELYGSEDTEQTLMNTFVQKVSIKKLPHNSTCAVDTLLEFIARDLRPVSVVGSHGFFNLVEKAEP